MDVLSTLKKRINSAILLVIVGVAVLGLEGQAWCYFYPLECNDPSKYMANFSPGDYYRDIIAEKLEDNAIRGYPLSGLNRVVFYPVTITSYDVVRNSSFLEGKALKFYCAQESFCGISGTTAAITEDTVVIREKAFVSFATCNDRKTNSYVVAFSEQAKDASSAARRLCGRYANDTR